MWRRIGLTAAAAVPKSPAAAAPWSSAAAGAGASGFRAHRWRWRGCGAAVWGGEGRRVRLRRRGTCSVGLSDCVCGFARAGSAQNLLPATPLRRAQTLC